MRAIASIVISALVAMGPALADNTLVSWGDGTVDVDFIWRPDLQEIIILHGNDLDYKFWVHDGSGVPGTLSIANIDVDDDATGDFTLLIQHPDGYAGALHWNEGDLRYAGGTSTVLGVKLDGDLGDNMKEIHIDQLVGSMEIDGDVWHVTIDEWLENGAGTIIIGEGCEDLTIVGDCPGDVVVDGSVSFLTITGDLTGSMDLAEVFVQLEVQGSIVDSGDNFVSINLGNYAWFVCGGDVELSGDRDEWLSIGSVTGPCLGYVDIEGVLSGVLHFLDRFDSMLWISSIDAGPTEDTHMQYGGIYFGAGSGEDCSVIVENDFTQGWIFAENRPEATGSIAVEGDMGQESPSTVARIITGYQATLGDPPVDYNWYTRVCGDVWPSADGEPVIYSAGNMNNIISIGIQQLPPRCIKSSL